MSWPQLPQREECWSRCRPKNCPLLCFQNCWQLLKMYGVMQMRETILVCKSSILFQQCLTPDRDCIKRGSTPSQNSIPNSCIQSPLNGLQLMEKQLMRGPMWLFRNQDWPITGKSSVHLAFL